MELLSVNILKKSKPFVEDIRWEVTPKIFLDPKAASGGKPEECIDITHGYMLYVDIVKDKPALVIMQLKRVISKTVGYIYDIPDELLKKALQCDTAECIAGMYPLPEGLEQWLKKEFGLS